MRSCANVLKRRGEFRTFCALLESAELATFANCFSHCFLLFESVCATFVIVTKNLEPGRSYTSIWPGFFIRFAHGFF